MDSKQTTLSALFGNMRAPLTSEAQARKDAFDADLAQANAAVIARRGSLDCRTWRLTSQRGADMGTYPGATAADAIDACTKALSDVADHFPGMEVTLSAEEVK